MSGNRSLDEFAGAGDGDDSGDDGAGDDGAGDDGADGRQHGDAAVDGAVDADDAVTDPAAGKGDAGAAEAAPESSTDPAPPASTYVWSPGGGACGACGSTVEERWRDGDDLVCPGCKEW